MEELKEKYGLFTAIAMVVGIVIGSGVFFKAEKVLQATNGNVLMGIVAWIIGGVIMIINAYTFSVLASNHHNREGLIGFAEKEVGGKYSFYIGWFMAIIYYPTLTSVLAWLSARYVGVLFGLDIVGSEVMTLAGFFLIASFCVNALAPKIAGHFQVTTTIIKLIPLMTMAIAGTIYGLVNGIMIENFHQTIASDVAGNPLFTAVVATAFAYEGWIVATSINGEIKNSKRNLPLALLIGTVIILVVYVAYYLGFVGAVSTNVIMESGEKGARLAFETIFGAVGGTMLFVFIVISCLGTLNGLMLGCTRGLYAISNKGINIGKGMFSRIDNYSNMPSNSAIVGLFLSAFWLVYFYGANLSTKSWFGLFSFDSSELPIVTIYGLYIPIFLMMIIKEKKLGIFRRFVMPILSIISCLFMIIACVFSHGLSVFFYLIVFIVIMSFGFFIYNKGSK